MQSGHVDFGKKRGKKARYLIESYPVGQTVSNLKDDVQDKAKLVTERHRYNLESVDSKMMQSEYVVASLPSAAASHCQLHCLCNYETPGAGGLGRHWQNLGGLAAGQQPH